MQASGEWKGERSNEKNECNKSRGGVSGKKGKVVNNGLICFLIKIKNGRKYSDYF